MNNIWIFIVPFFGNGKIEKEESINIFEFIGS